MMGRNSLSSDGERRRLAWKASHVDDLSINDLREVLRYTARLAELYEMYILSKGVRYLWEADDYIQANKGRDFPLL